MGNEDPSYAQRSAALALRAMAGCVLFFAVVRFALDRSSGGPFLLHSPSGQLAFSVQGQLEKLGYASSTQVKLLGWELLSSETPKPGGRVRVRLYWQPNGPIKEELLSFLHLYTPALQRSWTVDNRGVPRPDSQWWDPDRYYVDDLFLRLPSDLPPITYSLVAGLVTSEGERLTVPSSPDDLLYLRTLDVAPTRPGLLQIVRPTIEARAATADGLGLQGYDLLQKPDESTLRLFWETGDGVSNDWITYIHLHDPRGERVAQFDGPALAGLLPTSQWHSNALYIDRRQLEVPAGLEAGRHLFRVGLYDRASGERLPFQPDVKGQLLFEDGQLLIHPSPLRPPAAHAPDMTPGRRGTMSNRLWIGLSAVLFIVLMTLLLASPLWQLDGLPGGTYDAGAHIHRSAAMYRSFEQGVYWPRWFPGAYTGLGEPTFHHYSPGFYWLAAAAQAAGFRFDHSLKLVVTVALALSAFGRLRLAALCVQSWQRVFRRQHCICSTHIS